MFNHVYRDLYVKYTYTMRNNYECTTFETFDVGNYFVLINKVSKRETALINTKFNYLIFNFKHLQEYGSILCLKQ